MVAIMFRVPTYLSRANRNYKLLRDSIRFRQKPVTELIAIQPARLALASEETSASWKISHCPKNIDTHNHHLEWPKDYPTGIPRSGFPGQHVITKIKRVLEFIPLSPKSPFSSFRIAIHQKQLSMIAFIKPAVTERVINGFSLQDEKVSEAKIIFANRVGHDRRSRLSYIGLPQDQTLVSFLAAVHRITPFDSGALALCHDILKQCASADNQGELDCHISDEIEQVQRLEDDLRGYPNKVPDDVDFDMSLLYTEKETRQFPDKIPLIHCLVLSGNIERLESFLKATSVEVLFQRDPWGKLAIELAGEINMEMGLLLFDYWFNHPKLPDLPEKPLFKQYTRAFHYTVQHNCFLGTMPELHQKKASKYWDRLLPGLKKQASIYEWAITDRKDSYADWLAEQMQLIRTLEKAMEAQQSEILLDYTLSQLPASYDLWIQALRGNEAGMRAAMKERLDKNIIKYKTALYYPAIFYMDYFKASLGENPGLDSVQKRIDEELDHWYKLFSALSDPKDDKADRFSLEPYHTRTIVDKTIGDLFGIDRIYRQTPKSEIIERLFSDSSVPSPILWLSEIKHGNFPLLRAHVEEIKRMVAEYPDLESVQSIIKERMPTRPKMHLEVMAGRHFPVDSFIEEERAFNLFYHSLIDIHKHIFRHCMQYIENIPEEQKNLVLYTIPEKPYTLVTVLFCLLKKPSVIEYNWLNRKYDHEDLLKRFEETRDLSPKDAKACYEKHATAILKYQNLAIQEIQGAIEEYRKTASVVNELDFEAYTKLLALAAAKEAYEEQIKTSDFERLLGEEIYKKFDKEEVDLWYRLGELYSDFLRAVPKHLHYRYNSLKVAKYLSVKDLARQYLLSYNFQDEWGYTPLLLAIVSNNLAYVEAFFEAGLYLHRIEINSHCENFGHYRLLEHVQTQKMLELLLFRFTNPNQPTTILNRASWAMGETLLRYEHQPQKDPSMQTMQDRLLRGNHQFENPAELLANLLKYHTTELPDGSYDHHLDEPSVRVIQQHNIAIAMHQAHVRNSAKIATVDFQDGHIHTAFASANQPSQVQYESRLMRFSEINVCDGLKQKLADIYASSFGMPNDSDKSQSTKKYFINYIKKHPDFYIDVYFDVQKEKEPIGFLTFSLKQNCQREWETAYNVMYVSLIACTKRAAGHGLSTSSIRTILSAYQLSQADGKKLYFYARFGYPYIAVKLMVPGKWSCKYAVDKSHTRYVIQEVADNKEVDDNLVTSKAPVYSLAKARFKPDRYMEEFEYLRDKHQAEKNASICLVSEVDDSMFQAWLKRVQEQNGMSDEQLQAYIKAFEAEVYNPQKEEQCYSSHEPH
jgi:ankyrin repeat protein